MGDREASIRLGELDIVLPEPGRTYCYVFHDLAGLLGLEYNAEAVDIIKAGWKSRGKRGRLDIDHEADFVSIHAGRDAIVEVVALVHELATPDVKRPTPAEVESVRATLKRYKVPPPSPWGVGDVFAAPLVDGSFAIGQVLWEPTRDGLRSPTVALLDYRLQTLGALDPEELETCRTLSILHVQSRALDTGKWRVLDPRPVMLDPFSGPCGHPQKVGATHWDGLENLANAWHGLEPWNAAFRTSFLVGYLLRGVARPVSARMLTKEERAARGLPIDDDTAYKQYARQFR